MTTRHVGVADAAWTRNGVLSTIGLGSCVGVAIYDPVAKLGGLVHFQLDSSAQDPARAERQPFLYGDRALDTLSAALTGAGAVPPRTRVVIAGGAQMLSAMAHAQVGKRNVLSARKALWRLGYLIESESVGGSVSRNLILDVAAGSIVIR